MFPILRFIRETFQKLKQTSNWDIGFALLLIPHCYWNSFKVDNKCYLWKSGFRLQPIRRWGNLTFFWPSRTHSTLFAVWVLKNMFHCFQQIYSPGTKSTWKLSLPKSPFQKSRSFLKIYLKYFGWTLSLFFAWTNKQFCYRFNYFVPIFGSQIFDSWRNKRIFFGFFDVHQDIFESLKCFQIWFDLQRWLEINNS